MSEPIKEQPSVTPEGENIQAVPAGVIFHDSVTQVDDRGTLVEMFDTRWGWHPGPLTFAYAVSIRPGAVKGWVHHKTYDDRLFILFGELKAVLYDDRLDSPTRGLVAEIYLSEYRRRIMCIPANVWHAVQNVGERDAVFVNFPTAPYSHNDPDKHRLPLDNDAIPYKFKPRSLRGGR